MNCPNGHETKVAETRATPLGAIRRRRHCATCGWRATTYEILSLNDERPGDTYAAVISKRQLEAIRKLARESATLLAEIDEAS